MSDATVITGAGGWLGCALLQAKRDSDVRALVGNPGEVSLVLECHPDAEIFVGDIADPALLARIVKGAESVIHAAGVIHPKTIGDFDRVNHIGTKTVLQAAKDEGIKRLVHVSSNSPFGLNPTNEDVFRAEEPYNPYMGYGRSKMAAEIAVREAEGIETVVVRPPWFYGPWQPARQTRFFTLVRSGRFPLVGDGLNRRSMVYIDHLVQGVLLAESVPEAAGGAYWIADERPYTMSEVLDTVRRACEAEGLETKPQRTRLPALAGTVAQRLDGILQQRGKYSQELHVLGEVGATIACDISRSKVELGFNPEVSLEEGMRRSIRWCRERGIEL